MFRVCRKSPRSIVWPAVRNAYVFRGGSGWQVLRNPSSGIKGFIDPTQAPLKK